MAELLESSQAGSWHRRCGGVNAEATMIHASMGAVHH